MDHILHGFMFFEREIVRERDWVEERDRLRRKVYDSKIRYVVPDWIDK